MGDESRWWKRLARADSAFTVGKLAWAGGAFLVSSTWGVLSDLPSLVVFALALFIAACVLWIVNGFTWRKLQMGPELEQVRVLASPSPIDTKASASMQDMVGTLVQNKSIRIAELIHPATPGPPVIQGKTFEDCLLYGPAVISLPDSLLSHSSFSADPGQEDDVWIEIETPRVLYGVVSFERCTFNRCRFVHIGIIGDSEVHEQFRQALGISASKDKGVDSE